MCSLRGRRREIKKKRERCEAGGKGDAREMAHVAPACQFVWLGDVL